MHAADPRGCQSGHLVVTDDVCAVHRDAVGAAHVPGEPGAAAIHDLGVPVVALGGEALVLQPDRVHVHVPVAGVPADVLGLQVLGDVTVGRTDQVVPRHVRRVGDQLDADFVTALGVVNDDMRELRRARSERQVVVAVVDLGRSVQLVRRRHPFDAETVRSVDRTGGASPGLGAGNHPVTALAGGADGLSAHRVAGTPVAHRHTGPQIGQDVVGVLHLCGGGTQAARRGDGFVPGRGIGGCTDGATVRALACGEQRCSGTDVARGVRAERVGGDAGRCGRGAQGVDRGAVVLALGGALLRHRRAVDQMHGAVSEAAAGASGVVGPAGLSVADRREEGRRNGELAAGIGEGGGLVDGECLRHGSDGACGDGDGQERTAGEG